MGSMPQEFGGAVSWIDPVSKQTCRLKRKCREVIHGISTTSLRERCCDNRPRKLSPQTCVHSRPTRTVRWIDLEISLCKRSRAYLPPSAARLAFEIHLFPLVCSQSPRRLTRALLWGRAGMSVQSMGSQEKAYQCAVKNAGCAIAFTE